MKVALALLPGREIQNRVNRLAWQIHRRWNTGTKPRALPPHVSLKQPFEVEGEFAHVERYVAGLAAELTRFELVLKGCLLWETVFAIDVEPSTKLRGLHARLNAELPHFVSDASAPFDGDRYHFHLTVATGGASPAVYREIYEEYGDESFAGSVLATELAMFVYDTRVEGAWQYMSHTVLPLG